MATTRERGAFGEDFAVLRMSEDGYEILERNFRCGNSEIDVIVRRKDVIAFVEVKTRAETSWQTPAQAVSKAQKRRIVLAAVSYLKLCGIYNTGEYQPRFDVFEIVTDRQNFPQIVRYQHITAAYDTGGLHVFI